MSCCTASSRRSIGGFPESALLDAAAVQGRDSILGLMESALTAAGYRLECPGTAEQRELQGLFWWTLTRPGWTAYETSSGEWANRTEAIFDAYVHLLADGEFWR